MAKTDNLIDFLGDIADSIREKKGTTEAINAQDFANEIASIKTDAMRYFDVSGFSNGDWRYIASSCSLVKSYTENCWHIMTPGLHWCDYSSWTSEIIGAIAIDDREMLIANASFTPLSYCKEKGLDIEATFPEITKEEFYDLTWSAPTSES